ncbi:MAG: LVIVD repeat-containing protein [Candidatus Kariarchaeaceae archaeon]
MKRKLIGIILVSLLVIGTVLSIFLFTLESRISRIAYIETDIISATSSIVINDTFAYLAHGRNGLIIVDISNSNNPRLAGNYQTQIAEAVIIENDIAYVADAFAGIFILNVSLPNNPKLISNYPSIGNSRDISLVENLLYVADGTRGLVVIDVSNLENPKYLGSYNISSWSDCIDVQGEFAYLGTRSNTLHILNISNPRNITQIGYFGYPELNLGNPIRDFVLADNLVYIAASWDGLVIADIQDPRNPVLIGVYDPGNVNSVFKEGSKVYISEATNGLMVVEVGDPTKPRFIEGYSGLNINKLYVKNSYIYTQCDTGLFILKWEKSRTFEI